MASRIAGVRRTPGMGVVVLALAGCGSDSTVPSAAGTTPGATVTSAPLPTDGEPAEKQPVETLVGGTATRCVVRLHGKGGSGGDTYEADRVTQVFPTGNADGWGARQWIYFPDDSYRAARDIVAAAATGGGCDAFVIDGFSNGAAFAAKLYCRGETFDGRLLGVVIDDPVPDNGTAGCAPSPDVRGALYWTTALGPQSRPGTDCEPIDWTCEGGTMVGIEAYAAALGLEVQASPHTEHEWYFDAPELSTWLSA
jgi:hypothetical protein